MQPLKLNQLYLTLSDGDYADLEKIRQRVEEWAGFDDDTTVQGPPDSTIVYAAFLNMVLEVAKLERSGDEAARRSFARSFFKNEEEEDFGFPDDPNDDMDRWCDECGQWLYIGCECDKDE